MTIPIPTFLEHLKVDSRGYPIPFFVPIVKGVPEFRFADPDKTDLAIDKMLCHICGRKLYKDYHYFISGPLGMKNQVSSDAAMHRHCAEYALQVCPHMLYQKAERKGDASKALKNDAIVDAKPEAIFLIKSRKYKAVWHPGAVEHRLIHYKMVSAEKYIYINNVLEKQF